MKNLKHLHEWLSWGAFVSKDLETLPRLRYPVTHGHLAGKEQSQRQMSEAALNLNYTLVSSLRSPVICRPLTLRFRFGSHQFLWWRLNLQIGAQFCQFQSMLREAGTPSTAGPP